MKKTQMIQRNMPKVRRLVKKHKLAWRDVAEAVAGDLADKHHVVYEICFETQIGTEKQQAKHYIGTTENGLIDRLAKHLCLTTWYDKEGKKRIPGSHLLRAVGDAGIWYRVVRIWQLEEDENGYELEKRLKGMKNAAKMCPVCNPGGYMRNGYPKEYPVEINHTGVSEVTQKELKEAA